MTGPSGPAPLHRRLVALATENYDDPDFGRLEGVHDEVEAFRTWLCAEGLGGRRFTEEHPELAADPTKAEVITALTESGWRPGDAVVLFVTGHGVLGYEKHYLLLHRSDTARLAGTAVDTSDLVLLLRETGVRHLLLVLDACFAGAVAESIVLSRTPLPPHWVVLPSAQRDEEAVVGALSTAVRRFLADLTRPDGNYEFSDEYLDVDQFVRGIKEHLDPGQTLLPMRGNRADGGLYCLPNPLWTPTRDPRVPVAERRRDLALPQKDLGAHWDPKSRGVRREHEPGWLFRGRAKLTGRLLEAVQGPAAATVVTGAAGSGKSAALARLVTLSDERFRADHEEELTSVEPRLLPEIGAVDVAVLATGKLHTQVLGQLCGALGVPTPAVDTDTPLDPLLAAWRAWLAEQDKAFTVVVDALDEATNPDELVTKVLARLEPGSGPRRLRLLVGVRSTRDADRSGAGLPLAEKAVAALGAAEVRVDDDAWWHGRDIEQYVEDLLVVPEGSPYRAWDEAARARFAREIGTEAQRSFLVAGISAGSLAAREHAVDVDDPGWRVALRRGVRGVFRDDLHHTLPDAGERRRAVTLLRAVAFGYGRGIPRRHIWPRMASAVGDREYTDDDVTWLLGNRLAGYLATDTDGGVVVHRLFHDLLRTMLREDWDELLGTGTS